MWEKIEKWNNTEKDEEIRKERRPGAEMREKKTKPQKRFIEVIAIKFSPHPL